MLSPDQIRARIYSGFLGKAIGVRLGAPVEPTVWTYERIRDTYGDITGYVRDYKNFAADDDTNGPIYSIRAMRDFQLKPTAQEVAQTWLNYTAEGHGMSWWGGYGISTEQTAYYNLKAGIPAPQSGSIQQNGATIAEQIGGQIFIDSWGWVNPENPQRAAEMSATAASFAHDGDGLNGARFIAAMIAAAFSAKTVGELFDAGLSVIPDSSEYARVINAVLEFHQRNSGNWRACREMLGAEFGYDRYPGICHIIPNAGVTALAMIYGEGDLPRTVEIATMCSWDTDCNAGSAGAIIGTFQGVQPSWKKYRDPINDTIICSGVTGTLNIVDIPTFTDELTSLALDLNNSKNPAGIGTDYTRRGVRFDFDLPGATHGFRTEGSHRVNIWWSDDQTKNALKIQINQIRRYQMARVFWKPFYRRSDFDDNKYRPMFSPLVASGQTVSFDLLSEHVDGDDDLYFVPYVRRAMSGQIDRIGNWKKPESDWKQVTFTVPETGDEAIDEVGVLVEYTGRLLYLGQLYMTNFEVFGPGQTRINPALEAEEWDAITRFTWNRGYWRLENDRIIGLTDRDADLWTGHAFSRDCEITASIIPQAGDSHLLTTRAQGTERFYAAGFADGKLVILANDFGSKTLVEAPFERDLGREYSMTLSARGDELSLSIDGKKQLTTQDNTLSYGMCGIRMASAGRMSVGIIEIEEG